MFPIVSKRLDHKEIFIIIIKKYFDINISNNIKKIDQWIESMSIIVQLITFIFKSWLYSSNYTYTQ